MKTLEQFMSINLNSVHDGVFVSVSNISVCLCL